MMASATRQKFIISCSNCEGSVVGLNGMKYPLHMANATVTQAQIDEWRSQGYEINVVQ